MRWTFTGMAVLALWAGYLAWFSALLRRRLGVPELRSMPLTDRLRWTGVSVVLLPAALALLGPTENYAGYLATVGPGLGLALWTFAPRFITSKVVPLALVLDGLYGFVALRDYQRSAFPATHYGLFQTTSADYGQQVLIQVYLLLAIGLWLAWRACDKDGMIARMLLTVRRPLQGRTVTQPRWGLVLIAVVGLGVEMLGKTFWLGLPWWNTGLTLLVAAAAVVVVVRYPGLAADLALAGLVLFGLYGIALAAFWPIHVPLPSPYTDAVRYGVLFVNSRGTALAAGVEGAALIGFSLWLVPRALDDRTRALLRSATDADLAVRVVRLTRTRADAVDTASAELRRLERDLHDGAQARLVALGMSLRAAERLIPTNPDAASALVAEARETSVKVLDELRDLVRGICPPVLADRGLADAVRALALDSPLRTEVEVDLAGRPDQPVETACYFAVAEALANAVKHADARQAQVRIWHADGSLRITVIDDGAGGADPRGGSGLHGLERRLGALDGVLAVNSPAGGPTIIAIEVPCALTVPHAVAS